jgi:hypothetical protein
LEQALGKTGQIELKSGPVFPLNPRKLFQKLKFWNSFYCLTISKEVLSGRNQGPDAKSQACEGRRKGGRQKAIEIARNLKKIGVPVDRIVQGTGLSIEEIERI